MGTGIEVLSGSFQYRYFVFIAWLDGTKNADPNLERAPCLASFGLPCSCHDHKFAKIANEGDERHSTTN